MYRTRAFITRGLYTFYPIFEDQKRFLRIFFCKFLTLCMVSIQEGVIMARVRYATLLLHTSSVSQFEVYCALTSKLSYTLSTFDHKFFTIINSGWQLMADYKLY